MIHASVNNIFSFCKYLQINYENENYEFIWDDKTPDYLVASEHIYYYRKAWEKFVELSATASILIFHAGECIAPDFNIFDYAICFDRNLQYLDRAIRMPTRLFYSNLIFSRENKLLNDFQGAKEMLQGKSAFCNFIYSNGEGHPAREKLFYKISEYKKVDSLGSFLHNTEVEDTQRDGAWDSIIKASIRMKSRYKFSIACENAIYYGYTSEKLFSSLEAHTIPIYWGNPAIAEEVNSKAFINCHEYDSFDEVLNRVKLVDENDELWEQMIAEPWLTEEQQEREQKEEMQYQEFMDHIFSQPLNSAKRRGEGFHPSKYKKWFYEY